MVLNSVHRVFVFCPDCVRIEPVHEFLVTFRIPGLSTSDVVHVLVRVPPLSVPQLSHAAISLGVFLHPTASRRIFYQLKKKT